jgi:probable HAF family extracellular repeat protein
MALSCSYAVGSRSRYGLTGSSAILTTPAFNTVIYLPIPYGGYASAINDNGDIVGTGLGSDGKVHGFLLINAELQALPSPVVEAPALTKGKRGKKK